MDNIKFLKKKIKKQSGINNVGRKVNFNKGGGHKRKYKYINFNVKIVKDKKWTILKHFYDANRTAYITLISHNKYDFFSSFFLKYILTVKGFQEGDIIQTNKLEDIREGLYVCCIQQSFWKCIKTSTRSSGVFSIIFRITPMKIVVKLPSKKIIIIHKHSYYLPGKIMHIEQSIKKKAGFSRWVGKQPTVRAVAMNPIDHPHGGGEGKSKSNRHPVTFKGILTRGIKTKK